MLDRSIRLVSLWACSIVACESSGSLDESTDRETDSDAPPDGDLGLGCERHEAPAASGAASVVGDGTSQSCTAAALQAALDAGGTITFDCGGPHVIALDERLSVRADVWIDGGGTITLDGGGQTRLLDMDVDNTAPGGLQLVVRGLTFRHGNADREDYALRSGGAILSSHRGRLYVEDCTFEDNVAGVHGEEGGGAIATKSEGSLVVIDSTFRRNVAGLGGGIAVLLSEFTLVGSTFEDHDTRPGRDTGTQNDTPGGGYGSAVYVDGTGGAPARLCGSSFVDGFATGQGGAVFLFAYADRGDSAEIEDCLFQGNTLGSNARGDALGGALRHGGGGPLTLQRSAFSNNAATHQGGALWSGEDSAVAVTNCTFFANRADDGQGGGLGGAVMHVGNPVELLHCTFVGNHAGGEGGAIQGGDGLVLRGSIVANNRAGNEWGIKQNCGRPGDLGNEPPPAVGGGNNLEWPPIEGRYNNPDCGPAAVVGDPRLPAEPVPSEQGTPTLEPAVDSPALDAGEAEHCPDVDQRGRSRNDGPCDLGAHERSS